MSSTDSFTGKLLVSNVHTYDGTLTVTKDQISFTGGSETDTISHTWNFTDMGMFGDMEVDGKPCVFFTIHDSSAEQGQEGGEDEEDEEACGETCYQFVADTKGEDLYTLMHTYFSESQFMGDGEDGDMDEGMMFGMGGEEGASEWFYESDLTSEQDAKKPRPQQNQEE